MDKKIIAIWGKIDLSLCESLADESMPDDAQLQPVGTPENKTTTLAYETGESQELQGTGGEVVDIIEGEGKLVLETTIIEPTKLYRMLGLTESTDKEIEEGCIRVNRHVVDKRFAFKFLPQRVGGWGIAAPVAQIAFAPSGEEAKGGSAKLRLTIIKGAQGYLYDRVTKKAAAAAASQD